MIRKAFILIFIYFPAIFCLHFLLSGFRPMYGILGSFAVSLLVSLGIVLVRPIIIFLTVKHNIFTRIILAFLFITGIIYIISKYSPLLRVTAGNITFLTSHSLGQYLPVSVPALPGIATLLIASLLLAIWGIIMHTLL